MAQAGSWVSGYTIFSMVKTKHLLTSLTFGLKDTWCRLECDGGRIRRNGVRWADRKLKDRTIKVEQNLIAGDMRETDLANPSFNQEDCRVHLGLLSLNLTERVLMTSEVGL